MENKEREGNQVPTDGIGHKKSSVRLNHGEITVKTSFTQDITHYKKDQQIMGEVSLIMCVFLRYLQRYTDQGKEESETGMYSHSRGITKSI